MNCSGSWMRDVVVVGGRREHHGPGRVVDHVHVDVRGDDAGRARRLLGRKRLVVLEDQIGIVDRRRHRQKDVRSTAGVEVHERARADVRDAARRRPEGRQVPGVRPLVARCAEIADAVVSGRLGDRLRDHALLEQRVVGPGHVVDDDVRFTRRGQGRYRLAHRQVVIAPAASNARLAPGAMSWMFSSIARPSSSLPAGPSPSTSTGLVELRSPVPYDSDRPPLYWLTLSEMHADRDAGAVDVELRAGDVGKQRRFRLVVGFTLILAPAREDRVIIGLAGHRLLHLGDRRQRVDRRPALDEPVVRARAVTCTPTSWSCVSKLAEVAAQALDLEPNQAIIEFDRGEFRGELARLGRRSGRKPCRRRPAPTPRLAIGPFCASNRLVSVGVHSGAGIAVARRPGQQPPIPRETQSVGGHYVSESLRLRRRAGCSGRP